MEYQFRYVVPKGTSTRPPTLQVRHRITGYIDPKFGWSAWQDVPVVVREEFEA